MNQKQLLDFAINAGIIDLATIAESAEMEERKKYINMHRGKIRQDDDGRWSTYLPPVDGKPRRLLRKTKREDLENAIFDFYKSQETGHTFESVFNEWIIQKLEYGDIMQQTADRYTTAFIRYIRGTEIARLNFQQITENDLEDFIKKSIHEKQLTQKAWADLRLIICGSFKYAKKHDLTEISITQFLGDLEISRKAFKPRKFTDEESVFTDAEVERIEAYINAAPVSVINLGILLAFRTGLRAGELAALKYDDIDGKILHLTRTEIRYKDETGHNVHEFRECLKGRDGSRDIMLTPGALDIINRIKEVSPGPYLFADGSRQIRGKAFSCKLYKICDYLNIQRRSLHKARKTYATKLINAGVNEKVIINQMGHTDIQTTKDFYFFNNLEKTEIEKQLTSAIG